MQKLLFLFFILTIQLVLCQEKINFEESDFNKLLSKSKNEKKLIFIDAYASWCGPCKLMQQNIFTDKNVAEYYNKNYINAHFDVEKEEGRFIATKYGVRSYPTFLFINSQGEVVGKGSGYMDAKAFIELGTNNNNPELANTNLKEAFLNGTLNQPSLLNFIFLNASQEPIIAKQASEIYFKNKKDDVFSGEEINTLLNFTQSVDDYNYKVFVLNKNAIEKIITVNNYKKFDNYLRLKKLLENATNEKTKTIDDAVVLKNGERFFEKKDLIKSLNIYKLNYYISQENYPAFEKTALEYYKNPHDYENTELLAAANIFALYISNKKSLQSAASWAEKVVMSSENFYSTSILATLYDKLGKKDEAKMFAEMAVKFANEDHQDATTMNNILNKK